MLKIDELKAQKRKALQDAQAICDLCEKESRDFSGEERQTVANLLDRKSVV